MKFIDILPLMFPVEKVHPQVQAWAVTLERAVFHLRNDEVPPEVEWVWFFSPEERCIYKFQSVRGVHHQWKMAEVCDVDAPPKFVNQKAFAEIPAVFPQNRHP